MKHDPMYWQLALIREDGRKLKDNVKNRNARFDVLPKVKGNMRGSYGPGFTEFGHHASSKRRLANLRIQNCVRTFDENVGAQVLIKA